MGRIAYIIRSCLDIHNYSGSVQCTPMGVYRCEGIVLITEHLIDFERIGHAEVRDEMA